MYYVLWKNKRVFFSQKKEEEEGRREESQLLVDAKQRSCWRNKINNFNGMYMFKKIIKKVFILFY